MSRMSGAAVAFLVLALFGAAHAGYTKGYYQNLASNTNLYTNIGTGVVSIPYIKDNVATSVHTETADAYGKNTFTQAGGDSQVTTYQNGYSGSSSAGGSVAVSAKYGRKLQGYTKGYYQNLASNTNLYTNIGTKVISTPYIKDNVATSVHTETADAYGKNTFTQAGGDSQVTTYQNGYSGSSSAGGSVAVSAKYGH